jgi:hypothetical protein
LKTSHILEKNPVFKPELPKLRHKIAKSPHFATQSLFLAESKPKALIIVDLEDC